MIIYIDDKLDGAERRRLLIIQQIIYAMEFCNHNKSKAARFLGVSRGYLKNA